MKEKRTITNESGKELVIMIDPEKTFQHFYTEVDVTITPYQWRRIVRESDKTAWMTETGATIVWTCYPYANGCIYPGRM